MSTPRPPTRIAVAKGSGTISCSIARHADPPAPAACPRPMKRYRPLSYDFDARANVLRTDISPDWEPSVREVWQSNKDSVVAGITAEFGEDALVEKVRNFTECGDIPLSVIAFHNTAFRQVRNSFVLGAYYPALTGACALGERILNHLVLGLRTEFRGTPEYKRLHGKGSIDDWREAVAILDSWRILRPSVSTAFTRLRELRHKSIHFDPATMAEARARAIGAITLVRDIVHDQFGAFGDHPWFFSVPGVVFVKKSYETDPFVRLVYLPNCALVGPRHRLAVTPERRWIVEDDFPYQQHEITDEEFVAMYQAVPH